MRWNSLKIKIILLLMTIFSLPVAVNATSGRLKKDTVRVCGGTYYGQHGSNNHWHTAEESGGYWYATGPELSYNPCEETVIIQSNNDTSYSSDTETSNNLPSDSYYEDSNSAYENNSFVSSSNDVNIQDKDNIKDQSINDDIETDKDSESDFIEEEKITIQENEDTIDNSEEDLDESFSAADGIIGLGAIAGIGFAISKARKK